MIDNIQGEHSSLTIDELPLASYEISNQKNNFKFTTLV